MRQRLRAIVASIALLPIAGTMAAEQFKANSPDKNLKDQAAQLAGSLAQACPVATYNNEAAFEDCARTLRRMTLPFEPAIAWGGDQPDKQIRKKGLTHFNSQVFQTMYLPLLIFTGR